MKTAEIWIEVFTQRTTGRRRMFTIVNLTLDAVKTVIGNTQIKLDTDNAIEDINNGYMRRVNCTGFYNGNELRDMRNCRASVFYFYQLII